MNSIDEQIRDTLEKIRPFLQRDGGDVEFVKFEDGVVFLRMQGACVGCSLIDNTISDGVELILIDEVPGVVKVQLVE
ncbi:MAG: NifU family protein [Bacilli bacterium]